MPQVFGKSVTRAEAGDNVGVLLRGVKREFVERGMFLGVPGQLHQSDHFAARIYMLTSAEGGRDKPITSGFTNVAYVTTWTMPAMIEFEGRPMLMPGELIDHVEMLLRKPMVFREGQRFVVREKIRDRHATIISGIVTKPLPDSGRVIHGFNYIIPKRMVVESNASVVRRAKASRKNKSLPS